LGLGGGLVSLRRYSSLCRDKIGFFCEVEGWIPQLLLLLREEQEQEQEQEQEEQE